MFGLTDLIYSIHSIAAYSKKYSAWFACVIILKFSLPRAKYESEL